MVGLRCLTASGCQAAGKVFLFGHLFIAEALIGSNEFHVLVDGCQCRLPHGLHSHNRMEHCFRRVIALLLQLDLRTLRTAGYKRLQFDGSR